MSLEFVSITGRPMGRIQSLPARERPPAKDRPAPVSYHKGWIVTGIPAGALDEAKEGHARVVAMAQRAGGALPEGFDEQRWLMTAKRKRVRAKAYELESAARTCADLAKKAGWLCVDVAEDKKVVAA